ncbi:MAG: Wzz/FepE/Etk N-terminal domain-containing protein [Parcubacteria group bacterium]
MYPPPQFIQPENQTPIKHEQDADTVDLYEYLMIIWKKKISILAIVAVIAIAALVVNLILPKTYENNALINIGAFKNTSITNFVDMKAIFNMPAVLQQIQNQLSVGNVAGSSFNIEKYLLDKENASFIVIKGFGKTPEQALEITSIVIDTILKQHQVIFDKMIKNYDMEIQLIKRDQTRTEQDIAEKQQEINRIENDIALYQKEIDKRANIQSYGQGRMVESYINLIASAKSQKESRIVELANLKQKLANFDTVFQQKEFERVFQTKMTSVEVPPILTRKATPIKIMQNVKIAAILALFVGILYAFAADFFQKHKTEITSK